MGKSTAAGVFRRAHIPVFDADATVHRLQGRGGAALPAIAAAFPGTVRDGALDRARLREAVVGNDPAMKRLEQIIHPLVRRQERAFIARARRSRAAAVVLDIPLLFETGGDKRVDFTIVVSAPRAVQIERIRRRRGMTQAQTEAIIARQMPDSQKRRRADLVVRTGLSRNAALRPLRRLIRSLRP